jgi:hypothetical protein
VTEVEIFWPAALPTDPLLEAEAPLREAGVGTTCRLQRPRRGPELAVLVFVTTSALKPMLQALFEHVGDGAHQALRRFVSRLLKRDDDADAEPAPRSVVFESSTSGAQFVFTSNLPDEAFRKAVMLDPATEPGRWVWDQSANAWLRFEDHAAAKGDLR